MTALVIAILGGFVTASVLTYRLGAELERRAANRASLRLLAAYGDVRTGGHGDLDTLVTRAIAPAVAWASRLGHQVSPAGYAESAAVKLQAAGIWVLARSTDSSPLGSGRQCSSSLWLCCSLVR